MANELYFGEIDCRKVRRVWIPKIAQHISDEFDDNDHVSNEQLSEMVDFECERYAWDALCGITIIAAYGWSDALIGQDYEDSPYKAFVNETTEFVVGVLEERGIEIE